MKTIKMWLLKIQLAGLFKKAQLYTDMGKEQGDDVFNNLLTQADALISRYNMPEAREFGAYKDLVELTAIKAANQTALKLAIGAAVIIALPMALGAISGLVAIGYHAMLHICGQ